ncbi:hypothetical protein [Auritidibacter sp. NML100628]|uniref:hypothetical protein n=1 Tax=Auritidibacter sp. NML100628 TaxID=2170742 RepID=UPI000D726278|nr:hypothetical protein [Auritidibacter sp. NML100628]PXA75586.1 hypothetical protein DCC24_10555 [Auritidibacter sp. NML100628]
MTQGTEDPHNGQHVSAGLDRNLAEQAQRRLLEEQLINNELTALVATSALGMGFDNPDRGFVIRLGAPSVGLSHRTRSHIDHPARDRGGPET